VSHWMWFIFPQIEGLGFTAMSQEYAISDLDEARAYLSDHCPSLAGIVDGLEEREFTQWSPSI